MTENIEHTEITASVSPPERGRVRWYHVVVLGVAVLVCAAAVGFFVSQSSERDDATAQRRQARAQLATQRDSTTRARTRLLKERDETKAALDQVGTLTTSLHEFFDLVSQEVDTLTTAHQLAMNSPDAIDEYNAQVQHAKALLLQMQTKAEQIQQQAEALRRDTQAQLAVASSSR